MRHEWCPRAVSGGSKDTVRPIALPCTCCHADLQLEQELSNPASSLTAAGAYDDVVEVLHNPGIRWVGREPLLQQQQLLPACCWGGSAVQGVLPPWVNVWEEGMCPLAQATCRPVLLHRPPSSLHPLAVFLEPLAGSGALTLVWLPRCRLHTLLLLQHQGPCTAGDAACTWLSG